VASNVLQWISAFVSNVALVLVMFFGVFCWSLLVISLSIIYNVIISWVFVMVVWLDVWLEMCYFVGLYVMDMEFVYISCLMYQYYQYY
jgi:hypothetical protein